MCHTASEYSPQHHFSTGIPSLITGTKSDPTMDPQSRELSTRGNPGKRASRMEDAILEGKPSNVSCRNVHSITMIMLKRRRFDFTKMQVERILENAVLPHMEEEGTP